jgi:uncharacterized ion transporter superfamily protein YfcC
MAPLSNANSHTDKHGAYPALTDGLVPAILRAPGALNAPIRPIMTTPRESADADKSPEVGPRWYTRVLRRLRMPHAFALLTMVTALAAIATWVVPSGEYRRETRVVDGRERTVVVPGTFTHEPKAISFQGALLGGEVPEGMATPVSLLGFLSAVPRGLEAAADIVFFIFLIGGTFGILQHTGTIPAAIRALLDRFGHSAPLLTVLIMLAIAIGGSTLGMGEEFIPLIPVFLVISNRLGYDRIYGLALVMLAADIGFAAATTNPFTVNIAQGIAELPFNSGLGLRLAFFALAMTITIAYVLRYGARIKANPAASLLAGDTEAMPEDTFNNYQFTARHKLTLISCAGIFAVILWGVQARGWWINDMAGGFLLMGIVAAIACRLSLEESVRAYVHGLENMVVAALVVGFARAITVVLDDGHILDTLVHSAATALSDVPPYLAVEGMFLFQSTLNVLIPSGSGQAAVTMPLMVPLADVLGLTRQTAVLAFQFGDGLSNTIVPTSGMLMAMLALAKVPYSAWLRFTLPLFLMLSGLAAVFLVIAVAIGYQ